MDFSFAAIGRFLTVPLPEKFQTERSLKRSISLNRGEVTIVVGLVLPYSIMTMPVHLIGSAKMEDLKLLCAIQRWLHDFLHHAGAITEGQTRMFEELAHIQAVLLKRYEPKAVKEGSRGLPAMTGKKRKWHNFVVRNLPPSRIIR